MSDRQSLHDFPQGMNPQEYGHIHAEDQTLVNVFGLQLAKGDMLWPARGGLDVEMFWLNYASNEALVDDKPAPEYSEQAAGITADLASRQRQWAADERQRQEAIAASEREAAERMAFAREAQRRYLEDLRARLDAEYAEEARQAAASRNREAAASQDRKRE